ncbi:hypothetical protein BIW11_12370 [Tropilaelaps mercedesae]|uniref:Uncharacterized protein n=1 Tax=Tropilaelaps mercedesae TaxID=418985 RepID=A0A1V9X791_9ACAR|nr:hypothetical protein BIW11_12370 [Tropilaelaps mercedesae]
MKQCYNKGQFIDPPTSTLADAEGGWNGATLNGARCSSTSVVLVNENRTCPEWDWPEPNWSYYSERSS